MLRAMPSQTVKVKVKVQARARSLDRAIQAVHSHRPDLVFLDLQLGSDHGSALLPLLPASCAVVITTAYSDFAVSAFDAGVRDYLLKPIRPERLARCLERLQAPPALTPNTPVDSGFWLESTFSEGKDFVPFDEVLWVAGMRVQTHLQLQDRDPIVLRRPIREWEALLPADRFQRLDRSTIIQFRRLKSFERVSRSLHLLHFHSFEQTLAIGATAYRRLRELLAE
ncbi:Transcriptional regulator protein [Synechococcus sp. WH 8101]|uniref:LytR/AlgR family response regulator transcription factor n=1 Tax=Synechococcus sp. WH 8101 TaxID=59932 RepID=UPI0010246E08|nr:LytTR family DNA-binding domain-containing protein [Synechococcus sp. WH 8101]QBE70063.1 Transcriptional regulator protein [Synechococcus sp. WH 8101]